MDVELPFDEVVFGAATLSSALFAAAVFALALGVWLYRHAPRPLRALELLAAGRVRAAARRERGTSLRALLPPAPRFLREGADLEALRSRVLEAGSPAGLDADLFYRLKFGAAVLGGICAGLLFLSASVVPAVVAVLVAALGAYQVPDLWISSRITVRVRELERALPNMTDSLVLALDAGMDLEGALRRVAPRQRGALGDALGDLVEELGAGAPLGTALERLAERTRSSQFREVLSLIQQSRRLGVGLAAGLRVRAQELRTARRLRTQEAAQQAPLKMLFPLVLFFLPALLLVFLSPAVLALVGGQ